MFEFDRQSPNYGQLVSKVGAGTFGNEVSDQLMLSCLPIEALDNASRLIVETKH